MILLVCDIGNSYTKSAIIKNDRLIDFKINKNFSLVLKQLKGKDISTVVISSVVPSKTKLLVEKIRSLSSIKIFLIHKDLKFNLAIKYDTPRTLGMDRICSAEGTYYLFRKLFHYAIFKKSDYLISVDFGTATTINVIKYPNNFLGGLIAPGIDIMFNSLHSQTAQLPKVTPYDYKTIIGSSTKTSIASGVINSIVGMINQFISSLPKKPIKVFVTGGNAKYIIPHLTIDLIYERALVLWGAKAIYDKNKSTIT